MTQFLPGDHNRRFPRQESAGRVVLILTEAGPAFSAFSAPSISRGTSAVSRALAPRITMLNKNCDLLLTIPFTIDILHPTMEITDWASQRGSV